MNQKATTTYYLLSAFLLMTALFVLQPTNVPEVASLQTEVKTQFSIAWQQTIGDRPYFDDVASVFDGITAFYDQSADATAALFAQPASDQAIYYVFSMTYKDFAQVFEHNRSQVAGLQIDNTTIIPTNFMMEPALDNIVPDSSAGLGDNNIYSSNEVRSQDPGQVSGAQYQAWSNITDASTGQIYCLAIYNGEVNKYVGSCKYDYH